MGASPSLKYHYSTQSEALDAGLTAFAAITPEDRQESSFLHRPALFQIEKGYHIALTRAGYNAHKYNPFYPANKFLGFVQDDGSLTQY